MSISSVAAGDARFALRTLARTPLLTSVAVLTVALGVGATTAVFSVVNAVLLQPLPYAEPDRIVRIVENVPAEETPSGVAVRRRGMSQTDFEAWRTQSQTFSHLAMAMDESATLRTDDGTVLLDGARVTPALFGLRGIPPVLGRGLVTDDERPDAEVVVISDATWRRYLAADPSVIGRLVTFDGQPRVVVGVMPPEFGSGAFWMPLYIPPPQPGRVAVAGVTARLRDGISLEAAAAEVNVLGAQLRMLPENSDGPPRFELVPELDFAVAPVLPALRVLIVAVAVVLLIVCTNVANLLLARGVRRQQEIAIRTSLGASRGRITRQVLTESVVLAAFSGVVGVAIATGGVRLLTMLAGGASASAPILPRMEDVAIDPSSLVFAFFLSIAAGTLFGALPAFRLSRFAESVRTSGIQNLATPRSMRANNILATAQIALAMMLLVGAGLLLNSFLRLAAVDVGFDPRNVLSFDLVVPRDYTSERKLQIAEELVARLGDDARTLDVGFTDSRPLQPYIYIFSQFVPEGYTAEEIGEEQSALAGPEKTQSRFASAGYLRALGARLVSGVWLDDERAAAAGIGVLITRPFAQHYFGRPDAVGAGIQSRWGEFRVVGVVDDLHMMSPESDPERMIFVDPRDLLGDRPPLPDDIFLTVGRGAISFAARTTSDPLSLVGDLRSAIDEIDPALGLDNLLPMEQIRAATSSRPRFVAVLISVFAAVAAFIAMIGIYGVLAYVVGQRTKEIGVRIALGATRGEVSSLILRRGVSMVAIGIGAGLVGAVWFARYLEGMLFGITQFDYGTYASVAVAFALVALFASYAPARRAMAVDPMVALRNE